jgi:hypothetical protein
METPAIGQKVLRYSMFLDILAKKFGTFSTKLKQR